MIDFLEKCARALVIAPHPDDEVLGVGGTIARLAETGTEVDIAIVTSGQPPRFPAEQVATVRAEARDAHAHLGVANTHWLDFPAAELDKAGHAALNAALIPLVGDLSPDIIFAPHPGDIHLDHQLSFLSTLVASRPYQNEFPGMIMAYETLSETNWNAPFLTTAFTPNVFVDITDTLERKLEAFGLFKSQVKQSPHERAPETIEALAKLRGATVHRAAAEAFILVRGVF